MELLDLTSSQACNWVLPSSRNECSEKWIWSHRPIWWRRHIRYSSIWRWGRKLRPKEETDLLKVTHLLAQVNLRALPQFPLPPGLVWWRHPVPADLSLSIINISYPWLGCCLSLPMATITPPRYVRQVLVTLPGQRIWEISVFFFISKQKSIVGVRAKKQMTVAAASSAKPNTECPADLRWIQ